MAWFEVKRIHRHLYLYRRWRDYLPDGRIIHRSEYIRKWADGD